MDTTWLVLLVFAGLATYRITRLIVKDDFPLIRIPREWIVGSEKFNYERLEWEPELKHHGKWYYFFGELISCHWCASGWVSGGLTLALALFTDRDAALVDWVILWWAIWAIGAVIADKAG